jgi:hypothetical protein
MEMRRQQGEITNTSEVSHCAKPSAYSIFIKTSIALPAAGRSPQSKTERLFTFGLEVNDPVVVDL